MDTARIAEGSKVGKTTSGEGRSLLNHKKRTRKSVSLLADAGLERYDALNRDLGNRQKHGIFRSRESRTT